MGHSVSYIPGWAQGDKEEKGRQSTPQARVRFVSSTGKSVDPKTYNEEELKKKEIYELCVNSMFEAYITHSHISTSPECKAKIYRKKTVLMLNIVPIVRLVPVTEIDSRTG